MNRLSGGGGRPSQDLQPERAATLLPFRKPQRCYQNSSATILELQRSFSPTHSLVGAEGAGGMPPDGLTILPSQQPLNASVNLPINGSASARR